MPDFSQAFTVETAACNSGIGDMLSQHNHPIVYLSKALGIANCMLSVYEKEFLAVIIAIHKWQQYLQHGPFIILTDYQSL